MAEAQEPINQRIGEWKTGGEREEIFRLIFDRYYRPVYRFFEKRGFSAEECQDLTQETFLRVYKGMTTFRAEARFETWLFQIAANTFLKAVRWQSADKRAGRHVSLETVSDEEQVAVADKELNGLSSLRGPLDDVLEAERRRQVRGAMEELPEQMRKCVMLRVYQELSYQEIAVVLRLSVETVKTHLHQARQRLRIRLADYFSEMEV